MDPNAPPEDNTPEDNTPDDIPEGQGQEDEIFFCPDGNHPHAIDMGSGVLWSCCNIGAAKPTDYGDYYAWGETEPQYVTLDPLKWKYGKSGYDWITYKWCGGTMYTMTKYNYNSSFGSIDNKRELEREDDAAWVNSGHKWRMPTQEEFNRMIQNSNWKAVEIAGVAGLQFVSNINGNVLFFPAAGDWQSDDQWGTNYYDREYAGAYWTSTLEDEDFTKSAYLLLYFMDLLDPGFVGAGYSLDRCFGCSVRGIKAQ